ncbi:hypothetical protein XELAEV_18029744mg [Xenopus laevis]|uniref:Uncharacterized protein n=1 Tax=Xenopus laevis TaxID=8355 RepID=A0A974CS12_XENLA|nr:hypothetical protein XELAEV_18029744mg [Xenopus laevis]
MTTAKRIRHVTHVELHLPLHTLDCAGGNSATSGGAEDPVLLLLTINCRISGLKTQGKSVALQLLCQCRTGPQGYQENSRWAQVSVGPPAS